MSTHCKLGDIKATVSYSFGNAEPKTVVIKNVPIEVTTASKTIGKSPNYKREGYSITFYSPNNRLTYTIPVIDYIVTYYPGRINEGGYRTGDYYGISWWSCGNTDFNRNENGTLNGPEVDPNSITTNYNTKCPTPDPSNTTTTCSIEVKYNNSTIFTDSGDCPINYSVTCGEECPPGTIKCLSTNYPGYCCLPCSEIKNEIKAIASQVRSLNHG